MCVTINIAVTACRVCVVRSVGVCVCVYVCVRIVSVLCVWSQRFRFCSAKVSLQFRPTMTADDK